MENLKSEKGQLARLEQLRREKKYKEFFVVAEEAAMAFPDSYPVKFLNAEVLIETKQVEEAETVLQDLLFAYPDNINLLLVLGKVTFDLGKYDEAAECFNKILFLDPFNDEAKTLLVKIEKSKEGAPEDEAEEKPLNFITYTKEKEKARIDEFVMPEVPETRSDIDTTPFTAATKPEDEFDTVEKKPDFDTKKVLLNVPTSIGSPGQPPATPPPIPEDAGPVKEEPEVEFDIPSLDEPELPSPGPPPVPVEVKSGFEMPAMEFDIPSLDEPVPPPPIPDDAGPAKEEPEVEFDIPSLDEPELPSPGPPPVPVEVKSGFEIPEVEFDIPSLDEPVPPPSIPDETAQKADIDTKKVAFLQRPGADTKEVPAVGQPETREKQGQDVEITGTEDTEFDTPSLPGMEPEQTVGEFDIPPIGGTGREQLEIEYEIPGQGVDKAAAEIVADTIVEMDAPKIPGIEQGPPIPPPGLDDMPAAREKEEEFEYEIPAQRPAASEVDDFEIPSALEDSQDDIKVEYEIPAQEPLTAAAAEDEFEIPSPRQDIPDEVRMEYEIPARIPGATTDEIDDFELPPGLGDSPEDIDDIKSGYEIPAQEPAATAGGADDFEIPSPHEDIPDEIRMEYEIPAQPLETAAGEEIDIPPKGETDRDDLEIEPGTMLPQMEYNGTQGELDAPGDNAEDGRNQQEDGEFMTESAAELYLSQGLLDDALTIYEKLYRARKNERYLVKIKQISGKRVTQKKIQALTRLLNLIEKKGEDRV